MSGRDARVLAIVHEAEAGPGVFAPAIREHGLELEEWMIPEGGRPAHDPGEYAAVIALGGAVHADQAETYPWLDQERAMLSELLEHEIPFLGVCLGAQLLAQVTGGEVVRAAAPEIGWYEVRVGDEAQDDPLLGPLAPRFEALGWHSYEVALPAEATPLARSAACIQAFRVGKRAWGIQFHSEVTRRDLLAWIEDSRDGPDAGRVDLDALRDRSEQSIGGWNELGRRMAERFLAQAVAPERSRPL